jgi:hypothetical protein
LQAFFRKLYIDQKCAPGQVLWHAAKKPETRGSPFGRKMQKTENDVKTGKNPFSKHFCKNFIDVENVPLNELHQTALEKYRHHLDFFFRKRKKPLNHPKKQSPARS